jgi:hypothetical protein
VAGLLIRSQYTGAHARAHLTTIGAICVLLPILIPEGGGGPAAHRRLQGARHQPHGPGSDHHLPGRARAGLASGLAARPRSRGAHIIAWIWIVWPLVASILGLIRARASGGAQGSLDGFLYVPMAAMSWAALVGYGVASAAGKQLEHA